MLRRLVGAEAEEIVYVYGSAERAPLYRLLRDGAPVRLSDRFTGEERSPASRLVRDFVELTFANELDVLAHNDDLRIRHGDELRRLFAACEPYATEAAYAELCRTLGLDSNA